eukprot:840893-Rhodomonas_salina.1
MSLPDTIWRRPRALQINKNGYLGTRGPRVLIPGYPGTCKHIFRRQISYCLARALKRLVGQISVPRIFCLRTRSHE